MEDIEFFNDICARATRKRDDLYYLDELFKTLKANKWKLSAVNYDFAVDLIDEFFQECEKRLEGKQFAERTSSD